MLRGRAPSNAVLTAIARRELVTTAVNRYELLGGAMTAVAIAQVEELMDLIECLPIDEAAADAAAVIQRTLRSQGIALPAADTLIAGVAVARRLPLLTRNVRHFQRVPDLTVEST